MATVSDSSFVHRIHHTERLTHIADFHVLTILLNVDSAVPKLAASTTSFPFFFPTQNALIATKINHIHKLK
jgi:hypothetical protein